MDSEKPTAYLFQPPRKTGNAMSSTIWTWMHISGDTFDESALGLIAEARRLADEAGGGAVTVIATGKDPGGLLSRLGNYGANHVMYLQHPHLERYHGELFADTLAHHVHEHKPLAMLFAHGAHAADLVGRLGAQLASAVITRAVDAWIDPQGKLRAMRPKASGYLFETIKAVSPGTTLITFLPAVLADPVPQDSPAVKIQVIFFDVDLATLKTQRVAIVDADPETLDIEEADIIIAAGRGVGKGEQFAIIHRLARAIGGSVAGTRPLIDWQILPFERQIGQTGKTVSPRVIINCGISGANEYTAGIEKSQVVIAINTDAQARIFRFADLGVVGDLHAVLPLLVERLENIAREDKS
jgi:electron transfer flavoprotein alpha subunit